MNNTESGIVDIKPVAPRYYPFLKGNEARTKMRRALWLICLTTLGVALLCSPALAQSTATVRGEVVDEVGAVVPGAKVALIAADGKDVM